MQCRFWTTKSCIALILFNSLKESSEECVEPVFFCEAPDEGALVFIFQCREEKWLQAKGVMRKPRRKRGELEPAEGSPGPKMKVEESSSALGIKEEAGEVKVKIEDPEVCDSVIRMLFLPLICVPGRG